MITVYALSAGAEAHEKQENLDEKSDLPATRNATGPSIPGTVMDSLIRKRSISPCLTPVLPSSVFSNYRLPRCLAGLLYIMRPPSFSHFFLSNYRNHIHPMPGLLKRRKGNPRVAVGRKAVENTTIITTGVVQHSPLLSLPYELFVIHIAPYIPGPEWPAGPIFWDNSHSDTSPTPPPEYYSRQNTLRALSQTCVRLRAIFLPLLWERFEAFRSGVQDNTMNSRNTRTTSPNSNMLSRRAAGLLRGGLAGYVR